MRELRARRYRVDGCVKLRVCYAGMALHEKLKTQKIEDPKIKDKKIKDKKITKDPPATAGKP